ncbi:hypothetical protein M153_14720002422 [Pseudoloma neurophilia]|uniref:Uncharacterized protein n=1 Tax=Pseudoloma neurophilia TaxID=146866 RepID=A0A0R0LUP3_9MICR|nr:hypothetical protein M153_14720002422 [Pseudoloma neurophilia]
MSLPEFKQKNGSNEEPIIHLENQQLALESINNELVDSSFDASIDLPMTEDFDRFNDNIPSESQIESILSTVSRNIDQENIDPLTRELSPKGKPGSIRRAVLRDLTDKYLKKNPEREEPEESVQIYDEDPFANYTDSPLKNKNFREL